MTPERPTTDWNGAGTASSTELQSRSNRVFEEWHRIANEARDPVPVLRQPVDTSGWFYSGCCLELMHSLPENHFGVVLADLPYAMTACHWDKAIIPLDPFWKRLHRITKEDAAVILFASLRFATRLIASNPKHFRYHVVWEKTRPTSQLQCGRRSLSVDELMLVFYRKSPSYVAQMSEGEPYGKYRGTAGIGEIYRAGTKSIHRDNPSGERHPTTIWRFQGERGYHPTQKPVPLCEKWLRTYPTGDVFDPAMGSGTTGVACINTGRAFVGIEKEVKYFNVAKKRIELHNRRLRYVPE